MRKQDADCARESIVTQKNKGSVTLLNSQLHNISCLSLSHSIEIKE